MTQTDGGGGVSVPSGPITGLLGVGAIVCVCWATWWAVRIVLGTVFTLLHAVIGQPVGGLAANMLLSGIGGAFAGIALAIVRSLPRKPGHLAKSFISALFTGGLQTAPLGSEYLEKVLLGAAVGFLVGSISGAAGILGPPQLLLNTHLGIIRNPVYPVIALWGGGVGGSGGDSTSLFFLILVIIIFSVIVGVSIGSMIGWALAGATKGGVKAYVLRLLGGSSSEANPEISHPVSTGALQGALVGLVVGLLHGPVSAIALGKAGPAPFCYGGQRTCWLQVALKDFGYDPGTPDGVMGQHTRSALRQFQAAQGLVQSGTLDPETSRKLGIPSGLTDTKDTETHP